MSTFLAFILRNGRQVKISSDSWMSLFLLLVSFLLVDKKILRQFRLRSLNSISLLFSYFNTFATPEKHEQRTRDTHKSQDTLAFV